MPIDRMAVVGSGTMGAQIAAQSALSGFDVVLVDTDEEKLRNAESSNCAVLGRRVEKGTLSQQEVDAALARITPTTDIELVAECRLVIEAVFEDVDVKRSVFDELATVCGPETILATNSSAYPISRLFDDLPYPERSCNVHFFHPVLVMKLVEIMRGPETSDETVAALLEYVDRIGREAVVIERELSGLIVNRILAAIKREALWLASEGFASPEGRCVHRPTPGHGAIDKRRDRRTRWETMIQAAGMPSGSV